MKRRRANLTGITIKAGSPEQGRLYYALDRMRRRIERRMAAEAAET